MITLAPSTHQILIKAFDCRLHGNLFSSHHLCLNSFFLDAGKNLMKSRALRNDVIKMLNLSSFTVSHG